MNIRGLLYSYTRKLQGERERERERERRGEGGRGRNSFMVFLYADIKCYKHVTLLIIRHPNCSVLEKNCDLWYETKEHQRPARLNFNKTLFHSLTAELLLVAPPSFLTAPSPSPSLTSTILCLQLKF